MYQAVPSSEVQTLGRAPTLTGQAWVQNVGLELDRTRGPGCQKERRWHGSGRSEDSVQSVSTDPPRALLSVSTLCMGATCSLHGTSAPGAIYPTAG
eukprot:1154940-Pelagomonas_calceolata.AAC.1